jgi:lipoate synthase
VLLRQERLTTVCEEARCPNLGDCFARGTATLAAAARGLGFPTVYAGVFVRSSYHASEVYQEAQGS